MATKLIDKRLSSFDEAPCPNQDLEGPCHLYTGCKDSDGYGQGMIGSKNIRVHRHLWELANGPIPAGLVVDHQCRVRLCCNVKHLRLVTQKVNLTENCDGNAWQLNASKTRCKRGHEFTPENTRVYVRPDGRTSRECLRCHKDRCRRRYQRVVTEQKNGT